MTTKLYSTLHGYHSLEKEENDFLHFPNNNFFNFSIFFPFTFFIIIQTYFNNYFYVNNK